ncbi:hypothetical protein J3459_013966 [Metarhizium acridum]|uniref:uncharacterized protein n=1 Tax=Metarhizium acridum TaxID=92637 RepID=UPI001C6C64AB|nr:hypothetical protein J3458_021048 [Metarhizium acridum]KAG8415907.1 hypothetical protein J3459_013966 [Metarhizium acridum]
MASKSGQRVYSVSTSWLGLGVGRTNEQFCYSHHPAFQATVLGKDRTCPICQNEDFTLMWTVMTRQPPPRVVCVLTWPAHQWLRCDLTPPHLPSLEEDAFPTYPMIEPQHLSQVSVTALPLLHNETVP